MFLNARSPLCLPTVTSRALLLFLLLFPILSGIGAVPAWGAAKAETAAVWLAVEGSSQAPEASARALPRTIKLNTAGLRTMSLAADERPPALTILAPAESSKVAADEIVLQLAASDGDGDSSSGVNWASLELRLEGVPLVSACTPGIADPEGRRVCPLELPLGAADVRARVWDFAGLASEEAIVRFTVVEPEPGDDDGADDPPGTPSPFTPTRNDRGVEPNKVYLSDGDVETISTDSGHLTLAVPLGQRYGVGAQLGYQFRLVHNSNVWQPIQLRCEGSLCDVLPSSVQFASTNPSANAGLGWEIHFGKLYAPTAPAGLSALEQDLYPNRPSPADVSSQWLYVAPDGSRHELKSLTGWDNGTASRPVRYSTDSSQLRMLQTHNDKVRIEYPDGTFALFTQTDEVAGTEFCGGAAGGTGCWRFRKMQDPYGNKITADYSLVGSVETWTIADSTGRSHELVFSRSAFDRAGGDGIALGQGNYTFEGDEWGDLRRILTAVRLDTFGGGTGTYSFVYRTAPNVIRGCPHDTQQIPGGYATLTTRVLEQILTPEGESWAFGSNTPAGSPSGSSCNTTAGTLAWMRLPSGGRVDYGYGPWTFPTRCNYRASVDPGDDLTYIKAGVRTKTRSYPDGSVDPPWTYASTLVGGGATFGPNCERAGYRKTTVDGPEAGGLFTRQVFYSSVTEGPEDPTVHMSISGHQVTDAGLPFAKPLSTGGSASAQRYLSRETFECTAGTTSCSKLRSVYVRYASAFRAPDSGQGRSQDCDKAFGDGPDCFVLNPRLTAQRTVYHGDANRWSEQRWRNFNGAGTARIEEASDSWSGLNRRVSTTTLPTGGTTLGENAATGYLAVGTPSNYLPSPASDWLLHTWSRRMVQEAGISHVTEATFNAKGSLTCERRWKNGGSRSGQDLVRSLTYGASVGLNAGLPTLEILAGGDDAFLSTGTVCSTSGSALAGTRFQIQHGYQHLTRSSTQMAGGFPFSFNATIDRNTGRVQRSFDVAGQWADFEYDDLGRLTAVRPEAALNEADTLISYQVTLPTPPIITTSRVSGGQTLSWTRAELDGFGQVVEEQRRRPTNATGAFTLSARKSFYDPYGRLKKTTTWQDAGSIVDSHATRYRNYDPFGRARLLLAPDGQTTDVAYQGERRTCTTADVRTSANAFAPVTNCSEADGLGRTTRETNPLYETRYTYDPAGALRTAQRLGGGSSQVRSWTRDGRGFLTAETLPELAGRPITYRRDALGAVREHYDGQRTRRWSYDAGARPVELRVDGAIWEEFFWGAANSGADKSLGKLIEARRWNRPFGGAPWVVVERYDYAGALGQVSGRETQLHFPDNPAATQWGEYFSTSWSHDSLGRPTAIDYPRCLPAPQNGHIECNDSAQDLPGPAYTVRRTYQHDQLMAVSTPFLVSAAYDYHPNLQLAEATYGSGARYLADQGTNGIGRPARLRVVAPTGATWFDTGVYQYDPAGHIWAVGADRYTYDPAGRLKTATVAQAGAGRTEAYTYDPFDNLLSVTRDGGAPSVYQIDAPSNRLRGAAGQTPDIHYDLAGNMQTVGYTGLGTPIYEQGYDALNMAESFVTRNALSGAVEAHYLYLYGPGNRRLMTFDVQTSERVVTLRDLAGTPLREFSVTGWGPTAHWRYTNDYVSGPEGTFARRAANGVRRYLHRDHLGSLRLLTSGSPHNAITTGRHHYYPFGTSAYASGNDAPKSKYTGHERDPHGAADYMMGRTCVFPLQRFMSVDPGRDGWNLYAYVGNDPVRYVDPSGNERAQIWLDQDVERLLAGEITREQYHSNLRARGTGALAATSLFVPGPEDVSLAAAAVRFGGRLLRGVRQLGSRWFGRADDARKVSTGTANFADPKFAAQLEQQLAKDGSKSVFKSMRSLEKRLAEHQAKLPDLKYKSSVEREIRTFRNQIETLKEFIRQNGLTQ